MLHLDHVADIPVYFADYPVVAAGYVDVRLVRYEHIIKKRTENDFFFLHNIVSNIFFYRKTGDGR